MISATRFQVPKGMLQTEYRAWANEAFCSFQVPKGMLQTPNSLSFSTPFISCFKSPRECYKRYIFSDWEWRGKKFQVPKGMLQTSKKDTWSRFFSYVSSPQGNATNLFTSKSTKWYCLFQVPKGMLQTIGWVLSYSVQHHVSSPQGNATNNSLTLLSSYFSKSFKSPRECYKRILTIYLTLMVWVSSPQGNATNGSV